QPATLFWVEAQDGGNPMTKVPHRDRLMRLAAPFTAAPQAIGEVSQRFVNALWTARRDIALVTEYDRDRRWRTTSLVNLASGTPPKVLFDLSAQDAYHDPGVPVLETRPNGERVLLQDGDWIYLAGSGATESGDRPFVDRRNLSTLATERLFRCEESSYERFVSYIGGSRTTILTRRESPTEP